MIQSLGSLVGCQIGVATSGFNISPNSLVLTCCLYPRCNHIWDMASYVENESIHE